MINVAKALEDLIFPQNIKCHVCGEDLDPNEKPPICKMCLETIYPVKGLVCTHCGKPIESPEAQSGHYRGKCVDCQEHFSYIEKHRSYAHYEGGIKQMLMALKYKGKTFHVAYFVDKLYEVTSCTQEFMEVDLIVPVPSHWARRWSRGYNQAELLATGLAGKLQQIPCESILIRHRHTTKLKKLDKEARKKALHSAIILSNKNTLNLQDKRVLLVDDIYTTGATLEACAKVLYESGCAAVYAITVAMGY
jgi:ComF family protein